MNQFILQTSSASDTHLLLSLFTVDNERVKDCIASLPYPID